MNEKTNKTLVCEKISDVRKKKMKKDEKDDGWKPGRERYKLNEKEGNTEEN